MIPDAGFVGAKAALFCGNALLACLRDTHPGLPWPGMWDLPGGGREGDESPEDCLLRELAEELGLTIRFHQSNHEGQIVDWIHEARKEAAGIIINPAAYTHTSVAILDALHTFEGPVLEVHISNVHKRESFRHHSYVSLRAEGVIAGFGTEGYQLALRRMRTLTAK